MRDFNVQVGARIAGEEHIIGKHGRGKRSKNAEKLLEILLEQNLTLLNSMFRKKPNNKWMRIRREVRNEIDYIIIIKTKSFIDTGVIQILNFNTNHRMIRSCLNKSDSKKDSTKAI